MNPFMNQNAYQTCFFPQNMGQMAYNNNFNQQMNNMNNMNNMNMSQNMNFYNMNNQNNMNNFQNMNMNNNMM